MLDFVLRIFREALAALEVMLIKEIAPLEVLEASLNRMEVFQQMIPRMMAGGMGAARSLNSPQQLLCSWVSCS